MYIEEKIAALGFTLPAGVTPIANFVPTVQSGKMLYVSGHAARTSKGKLGRDLTIEQGYEAAREVALDLLGTVRAALGDLDRVARVVKLLGMVNSTEEFTDQPKVINGASDLLVEIFGEKGKHARSAVGMAQLPGYASVEIEMILEIAE